MPSFELLFCLLLSALSNSDVLALFCIPIFLLLTFRSLPSFLMRIKRLIWTEIGVVRNWGGVGGRDTTNRIYYVKQNLFSVKGKEFRHP